MKKSLIFYIIFAVYIGSIHLFTYNIPKAAGIQPENTGNNNNKLSLHSLVQRGSPLLGNPSAPITVVEFGDFQCDRCARFAKATEPQLNQTYIQPRKVNLVYKYFPNYGPDSTTAVVAAHCTNDQGKFWNYYDILYKNQGMANFGWASKDNLKKFGSQIAGLDMQKFNSCLDGKNNCHFFRVTWLLLLH